MIKKPSKAMRNSFIKLQGMSLKSPTGSTVYRVSHFYFTKKIYDFLDRNPKLKKLYAKNQSSLKIKPIKISHINKLIHTPNKNFLCIYYPIKKFQYQGLMAYVKTSLWGTFCALSKGYVPVIDMQSYPNIYLESQNIGHENAWEYYFEQPLGYTLNDIHNGKYKYKLAYPNLYSMNTDLMRKSISVNIDDDTCKFWFYLYREFLRLNKKTQKYVDHEYNELIKKGTRVLGVLYRGTDYSVGKTPRHNIQPSMNELIKKSNEFMETHNLEYIYLATDELKAVKLFEKFFPGKILTNSRQYYDFADYTKSNRIGETTIDRENDAYLRGLEYLSSMVILSRCNCLVAGLCGGTYSAYYMNGGRYENSFLFDLGKYAVDDKINI